VLTARKASVKYRGHAKKCNFYMRIVPFLGALLLLMFGLAKAKAQEIPMTKELSDNSANYYADVMRGKNICEERVVKKEEKKEESQKLNTSKQNKFIINASAYTAAADECGKSDGITASGKKVKEKHTLACPPQYKFGTKIHIEGMGIYECEDRGGAIKGNKFDIYMKTKQEAFSFGRRNLQAYLVM